MEIVRSSDVSSPTFRAFDSSNMSSAEATLRASSAVGFEPVLPREDPAKHRLIVFDEDDETCSLVTECLSGQAYDFVYCQSIDEVREALLSESAVFKNSLSLLLWGIGSPFESGLKGLHLIRESHPDLCIVLLAPQEAMTHAAAIKMAGVDGFVMKPLRANDPRQDLRDAIDRAVSRAYLSRGLGTRASSSGRMSGERLAGAGPTVQLAADPPLTATEDGLDLGLIGRSSEMRKVISLIRKVGPSRVNVLVTGESGTGKEMVAQAIHRVSDRSKKPFIAINCAAIPRELLESELFGHAKGAFTGATNARRGLFEEAHEGTILLDEIGDLPLSLQAKILRLLQTKQVKPLGQNIVKEVDVRIISATHKNLKALIQKGEFREDLYYRLNVMPMHLPPLRERKDDIVLLADHFLRRYAAAGRGPLRALSRKAVHKIQSLPWKGNVRELENVIERAIVLAEGEEISENEILTEEMEPVRVTSEDLFNAGMTLKDIEREYIKYVLIRTGNRKEAATRILGIDRKTLYRKEKLFGIRGPQQWM